MDKTTLELLNTIAIQRQVLVVSVRELNAARKLAESSLFQLEPVTVASVNCYMLKLRVVGL